MMGNEEISCHDDDDENWRSNRGDGNLGKRNGSACVRKSGGVSMEMGNDGACGGKGNGDVVGEMYGTFGGTGNGDVGVENGAALENLLQPCKRGRGNFFTHPVPSPLTSAAEEV